MPRKPAKAQVTKPPTTRIYISIATTKHTRHDKNHGWIVILTPERSIAPKRQPLWHITATPTGYESAFEEVAVDSGMAARLFQTLHRAGWIEPSDENEFSDVLADALGQYERRWVEVLFEEFEGVQGVARDIKTKLAVEIPVAPYEPGGELYQRSSRRSVSEEEAGVGSAEGMDRCDAVEPSTGVKGKSSSDHEEAVRSHSNSSPGSTSSRSDSQPDIHFDTDSESDSEDTSKQGIVAEPAHSPPSTSDSRMVVDAASSSSRPKPEDNSGDSYPEQAIDPNTLQRSSSPEHAPASASESRNVVEPTSSSSHPEPEGHSDDFYPDQAILTNIIQNPSSYSISSTGDSGSRSCIRLQGIPNSDSDSNSENATVTDPDSAAELKRGFIPGFCCHKLLCCEKHDCNEHVTCCEREDCDEDTELQCCRNARRPRNRVSYAA
ncbi:uncharacterized protein BDV14DRAFT_198966 [Aspergillus stella-maris]|uniref:uncharacterized protein n=1 Tax=Aspergillus stella-maris TaxID=1810926 RepID=UPI003CCD7900